MVKKVKECGVMWNYELYNKNLQNYTNVTNSESRNYYTDKFPFDDYHLLDLLPFGPLLYFRK